MNKFEILEKYYGYREFRKGQEEVIDSILQGKDVLAIMPTGGGKSICYQVPALILNGLTIVISPLISLMKDQVDTIKEIGIEAAYINSSLSSREFNEIIEGIREDKYKIIYIAPERLESYEFFAIIAEKDISQIAIDEAHCVSQWGHDFRSSYRRIGSFIDRLYKRPIITAFTATASEEVRQDIVNLLKLNSPKIFITGFDRENLSIDIIKGGNKKEYILKYIEKNRNQCGIIYASTRKEVDNLYEMLQNKGYSVGRYHAGLGDEERRSNQEDFIYDRVSLMIATNAFGMGIDKPNIRYVIHYSIPKNIEGYYQEIGRAGRDGEKSQCILLFSPSDIHTQKYLIDVGIENEERKVIQYKKLQQMIDLIYSNDCYRKGILNYFGEEYNKECGNCSNCLSEGEIVDKTIDAQKVLSCIYRMKRGFGTKMIVDVLRGSKNKRVLDLGFDKLSTYGIMKDYTGEKLKEFINTLVSHGFIDLIEGDYPVVRLNDKSILVLKGKEEVRFKEYVVDKKIIEDNELVMILKELRLEIAREEGVPPYIIFGDITLREMSSVYPRTKEEFLAISGIGEKKYDKYGERFSEVIKRYVEDNNINIIVNNEDDEIIEVSTDKELLNRLLEVRKSFALKENTLDRSIISIQSLKEISGRYPITVDEFKDISGVGPKKVKEYGEFFVEAVKSYVEEKNIKRNWIEKKHRKVIIDGDGRNNEEKSIDMVKEGIYLKDISEEIEVSISTILGYITDYIKEYGENPLKEDISNLYTEDEERLIINELKSTSSNKISELKKKLPDYIKYESIRAVIIKNNYI
ncbi:ATP-dependent DNA helicase RecQ [Clostridium bornimense]|uniref:DNA helicase RecQ n=1 Tax=Clostridium bornimense TaxID=1216932 RepID=W6S0Z7_9CLOT|nr:ATP-dependent DNA helicase RecQ [Clostridium bornimense]